MAYPRDVVPPNLPIALREYDQRSMEQFNNVLRLYFNQVSNRLNSPLAHASYYDTTTQTNPVANQVNLFKFNSVITEFQVSRSTPTSKILINNTGIYNFQFSAQLDNVGGGSPAIYIWPRVNGVNVPYSASKVIVGGPNDEKVAAWNFILVMKAGDCFELAWQSDSTDAVVLAAAPSGNIPGIPSVILTVNWVSNYEANE